MSTSSTLRAMPTLLRIGVSQAIAYRGGIVVRTLASSMPLVMLAIWCAVSRDTPVGRYGEIQFVSYFLATFLIRQLTNASIYYNMNFEIRDGTLSMRLLRPLHPLATYAADSIADVPLRALPLAVGALLAVGGGTVTHDLAMWGLCVLSIAGAWVISLCVNFAIGCSAFFLESSTKVMDTWIAFYICLSGYLIPVDLFPSRLRVAADLLPFRYQIGLPVEIMTGALTRGEAGRSILWQWTWALVGIWVSVVMWRRGVAKFAAYGG
jgi:ABC-2 type transport system permease protein